MLNKGENVPVAVSEHFRGGEGEVWLKDLTCGRKPPNVKVFSEMTLHKGCSVGYHTHAGDSEIIYVEASNYTGYHLVYFVGTDDYTYHDCLAQYGLGTSGAPEGLRRPDYNAWEAELISAYPVSINSFINWFAKV